MLLLAKWQYRVWHCCSATMLRKTVQFATASLIVVDASVAANIAQISASLPIVSSAGMESTSIDWLFVLNVISCFTTIRFRGDGRKPLQRTCQGIQRRTQWGGGPCLGTVVTCASGPGKRRGWGSGCRSRTAVDRQRPTLCGSRIWLVRMAFKKQYNFYPASQVSDLCYFNWLVCNLLIILHQESGHRINSLATLASTYRELP